MDRRTFLRTAASATVAAGLAGCSGGDGSGQMTGPDPGARTGSPTSGDPVPNLELGLPETSENDAGNLVVVVPVENVADSKGAGTLVVTVRAGDETYEESRAVTVPAGEERTLEVEFDVAYDEYAADGAVDFHWRTN